MLVNIDGRLWVIVPAFNKSEVIKEIVLELRLIIAM
jgi:hypothetical protein